MIKKIINVAAIFLCALSMSSCEELEKIIEELNTDEVISVNGNFSGLDAKTEQKNYASVPKEMTLITIADNVPATSRKMDLISSMPPIKSQGQYGTCTSWATGYYTRTIAHARENDLTTSDLEDEANQFSPLDIYLSISHGSNCGGSAISTAFKTMQERGIAKMTDVPYTNLGDCSHNSPANSSQTAPGKIDHFRSLGDINTEEIKSQLSMGRPIAVGCKLGPDFFNYKSGVFQDDDYSEWDAAGKHAGHAMCVVGYDDDKGPNGAFLIANSWGANWGDDGFIWVDYDFFTGGVFCKYGYVIESDKSDKPVIDNNIVDPSARVEGKDFICTVLDDRKGEVTDYKPNPGPRDRSVYYNVFNKGTETIPASDDWNIVYYYYNAFDPENDWGMIFYDYYTDDVSGEATKGQTGDITDLSMNMTTYAQWNWWNYIDVPAGFSVGKALDDGKESDMAMDYELPSSLNGEYYFVLFADGFNVMNEKYEQNNYLFFTGKDRKPVKITNGVIDDSSLKSAHVSSANAMELGNEQPNAYTPEEVATLINHQKTNGILQRRAKRFKTQLKSGSIKTCVKRFVPSKK